MADNPPAGAAAVRHVESSDSPAKTEDYVVVGAHRLVKPYHFDFCCNVRQRWFGQNIIDIFSREFPARDRAYYLAALADGRLRVEGCQVTAETPLRDGQKMRHFIHRHEPPVPAGPIPVVGQSGDMVAVCKPAGMPVHVAGQYRKNTVLGVLQAEQPELGTLYPVHRLDKPVSGLLLFARSPAAAAALCRQIEGRGVEKIYVARVLGRFPEGAVTADVPLDWDPTANMASAVPEAAETLAAADAEAAAGSGEALAEQQQPAQQPAEQQQQQPQPGQGEQQQCQAGELTLQERRAAKKQQRQQRKAAKAERQAAAAAAATAAAKRPARSAPKPARTDFRLLSVAPDGLTSVVECRPRTGRTHQIRVHLQYLGHPIANDAQYGGTYGGPLASRQMARELGVHWAAPAGSGGAAAGADDAAADAAAGPEAAAAPAAAPAAADAAAAECSKRPRLDTADGAGQPAVQQQQPGEQQQQPAEQQQQQPPGGEAGGEPCGEGEGGDAYALNAAFRSRPEYRLPPQLCDPLCTHCPYYAPRDYPLDLRPLWLHARCYSSLEEQGGWSFATELPQWAHADWLPPAAPPADA